MKCPVCSNSLSAFDAGSFTVDICKDGCAGIWLDKGELEKCNEHTDPFPQELLRVKKSLDVVIDRSKTRLCPSCEDQEMTRITLDAETNFEIDQCPTCKGHWLDVGELEHLRAKEKEEAEMSARIADFEKQVADKLSDPESAHKVKAFVTKLFR